MKGQRIIFVLGCPNGVLECMAAGLPVVATNIDSVREVLGPANIDLLAPVADTAALSSIILKLASDPALCAHLGEINKRRISEHYTASRMCEELLKIGDLMLKARLFAVLLIVACVGMIYYGWYELRTEGVYHLKMATFAPVGVVGGFFLLLFPQLGGKPNTTKEKVIVLLVFVIGLMAGLVNWVLMDPGFFGFPTK